MRSIGINLFLAYAGGAVLADEFEAAEMAVFTSMRLSDNVGEGISTFYAELLRIKEIIDYSHQGKPMIALVDEIYRGTNSQDRIFSAAETLRRLSKPQAMTIVTTHDFELCDLEKERSLDAVNYHFSEYYQHDEILFDYVIRPGRCQTTNARQLLRLVGIVD